MSVTNHNESDIALRIRELKKRRVRTSLTAGRVAIHQAAQPAFAMWQDLRRQFHPGALITPEVASALVGHIPVQAVKTRERWLLFGGFETYTSIQSTAESREKIRTEIVHYTNISHEMIESLSLALLLHNIGVYSLCGDVGNEQLRTRLKTAFSQRARDSVLACDPTSRKRYSETIDASASALKRQGERLRRCCSPDANFIEDILEELRHETTD